MQVGRWTSKDPSGVLGGLNLYGYSYNNPVNYIDLSGSIPILVIFAAKILGGAAVGATIDLGVQWILHKLTSPKCKKFRVSYGSLTLGATLGALGPAVNAIHVWKATRRASELGRKLNYFLGQATGSAHNIDRSLGMLRQLQSIGLHDNPATRNYLTQHLAKTLKNLSTIKRIQKNGRIVRESLLMGPRGGVKFETVWEGSKLITGRLFGAGR